MYSTFTIDAHKGLADLCEIYEHFYSCVRKNIIVTESPNWILVFEQKYSFDESFYSKCPCNFFAIKFQLADYFLPLKYIFAYFVIYIFKLYKIITKTRVLLCFDEKCMYNELGFISKIHRE